MTKPTKQQAIEAANLIREWCNKKSCGDCPFYSGVGHFCDLTWDIDFPKDWSEFKDTSNEVNSG